ncbi:Glycosyltransferase involved in cell wall bisynthesis [Salegentibacter echinorum]|uniref:Glycosyltransferase involved in cell wall bisynthesis n=1 Tax=Salegentibacter echinorum TaxID=1073325 RepID=A0A1M5FIP9_SALEC|nr:glycosyltransferase family 4 protein [Salegentibacter echinorum]SHF91375.1 Glycosyltransferase involved in cell wall bisynthesis [Salegentibacter echinorum]
MKVIIVINTLGSGGAERSMVELAKFLHAKNNISIKFVCLEHRKIGIEKEVTSFGIPVIFFEKSGGYFAKTKYLVEVLKQEAPDIIHSLLTESNIITRLSRKFYSKGKLVQSLVNTAYSEERKKDNKLSWQKFQLAKQFDIWTARCTPNVFYHSITKEVLKHYKPLFKIRENYKVIYRGRDENPFLNIGDQEEEHTRFTLINSGRQEFAKGQITILKALSYLREKYGYTNIKFQLLGRQGAYSDVIQQYIVENKLEEQVEVHGFVNDVQRRLVKADAFIFPSYYEGLGGALLEAFSAHLPCLCSDLPVLKEVVGSEKGAMFSPPGDFKALAENIKLLMENKKLQLELADYSLNRFQSKFKIDKINNEMLKMYVELLD